MSKGESIMEEKITEEVNQTEVANPVPPTNAPQAKVKTETAKPAESKAEKIEDKQTAAFIKMRREARELKRQLAEAKANKPAPQTATENPAAVPAVPQTPAMPTAPGSVKPAVDIEAISEKAALEVVANDERVKALPGAILDILSMVDTDPRLSRLHDIDPTLAYREAKDTYFNKVGVTAPPPVPKSAPVSGGIHPGQQDLEALVAQAHKYPVGSKKWNEAVNKVTAEMKKYKP